MTTRRAPLRGLGALAAPTLLLALAGTSNGTVTPPPPPAALPVGYPPLTMPAANPPSDAKAELGRRLFAERALSADGTIACADCHKRENGFSDGVAMSRGVFGRHGLRKTPSLLNVGYRPVLMWDGRAADLEEQIRFPLLNADEMGSSEAAAVAAVAADRTYAPLFAAAFGDARVTLARMGQAIATFERVALLGGDSPFDRFMFGGDARAISRAARRGWALFQGKGCIACHHVEGGNPLFTDFRFHNIGIGYDAPTPDLGRYGVTLIAADRGKFKTPSLVGVAQRAPYMHDGRFRTLREVIDYYDRGGDVNPLLDPQLKPLKLTERDKADLVVFLEGLTPRVATSPAARVMIAAAVRERR